MTEQSIPPPNSVAVARPSIPALELPDLNSGKYPFALLQTVLQDASTDFHFYARPESGHSTIFQHRASLEIRCTLHSARAIVQPSSRSRFQVGQAVGEAEGILKARFALAPDDFPWSPGTEPPFTVYDASRSQRLVMVNGDFSFGDGNDSFLGYAVGRTTPTLVRGKPAVLVGAVGNIVKGRGKFEALEGTFALNGMLTPEVAFTGGIILRMIDWRGNLRTASEVLSCSSSRAADSGETYVILKGHKKDQAIKSEYILDPNNQLRGVSTEAQWRAAEYASAARGHRGLRSHVSVGQIVGNLQASIVTNILEPPGTAARPVLFTTDNFYTFCNRRGDTIGTIRAKVTEGYSFNLVFPTLPGQRGLRFAGYGPVLEGTGQFKDIEGTCIVNSLITLFPHVLSLIHLFRISYPLNAGL